MSNQSKHSQTMIKGALISSAGIFFAKFIGLFYAIPFNALMGGDNANIAYYGVAFQIYTYLLNICTAGFPFAIATMVAKYSARGDYRTALLVKKLSLMMMMIFGFGMMIIVILFSTPLAKLVLPEAGNNVAIMRTVLILISFALFFVPVLSSVRGFYQGLKQLEIYALSQVLEQIARVAFLLIFSAIAVYMFQADRIWAVYFGVLSASVAAILAFMHMKLYDKKRMPQIKKMAREQIVTSNHDRKAITKELIFIAMPFLLVAILGYSDTIVNTLFLNKGLQAFGSTASEIELITGTINFGVLKLMSIPMILAPGFSSAIIPHITTALTEKKYNLISKNMRDCIDIVLYIGAPICFCLFAFAKPIYAVMFSPGQDLALCAEILSWFSIEAFFNTIGPVFTTLLMAVGLRRIVLRNLVIMAAVKLSTSYFLLAWLGYSGVVISTILSMGIFIILNGYILTKRYHIKWAYTFNKLLIIILGLAVIYFIAVSFANFGWNGYESGRMMNLVQLAVSGLTAIGAYFAITYAFQIPQTLFNFGSKKANRKK